jgi:hypothetical protein
VLSVLTGCFTGWLTVLAGNSVVTVLFNGIMMQSDKVQEIRDKVQTKVRNDVDEVIFVRVMVMISPWSKM